MMKKTFAFLLCVLMLLGCLAACGDSTATTAGTTADIREPSGDTPTEEEQLFAVLQEALREYIRTTSFPQNGALEISDLQYLRVDSIFAEFLDEWDYAGKPKVKVVCQSEGEERSKIVSTQGRLYDLMPAHGILREGESMPTVYFLSVKNLPFSVEALHFSVRYTYLVNGEPYTAWEEQYSASFLLAPADAQTYVIPVLQENEKKAEL